MFLARYNLLIFCILLMVDLGLPCRDRSLSSWVLGLPGAGNTTDIQTSVLEVKDPKTITNTWSGLYSPIFAAFLLCFHEGTRNLWRATEKTWHSIRKKIALGNRPGYILLFHIQRRGTTFPCRVEFRRARRAQLQLGETAMLSSPLTRPVSLAR